MWGVKLTVKEANTLYKRYSCSRFDGQFGTRHAGSQGNKCNGIDSIFEVDKAAKVSGNVSNHGGAGTDEGDRNDKSEISIEESLKKERN